MPPQKHQQMDSYSCLDDSTPHEALKYEKPTEWGYFNDETGFLVNLTKIEQVEWSFEGFRVHIIMKQDAGELAADDIKTSFPRQRTIDRFLSVCGEWGIKTTERESEELDDSWNSMGFEHQE
ncbi:hypothetical protein Forpe1208_v011997 [Fusarium oxysporum f. sp. rapae]|uniref:Uncharacterized protein n=1 Tax=Fusarium oxysporum f. sp. rapae TaxID=485398 RepID=A0A8J5TPV0_FUSOX|nr:hypothetical protein Forpe1208_v011997 [Fusarium oxysporum f. sp. rapae]